MNHSPFVRAKSMEHGRTQYRGSRDVPRRMLIVLLLTAAPAEAFGEIDCNNRCGDDYKSGCYDRCRLERGAEQQEALRKIDPELTAALERRFPKIEEIEHCGDSQCSDISIYTPLGDDYREEALLPQRSSSSYAIA
jgi:hypothetical protein